MVRLFLIVFGALLAQASSAPVAEPAVVRLVGLKCTPDAPPAGSPVECLVRLENAGESPAAARITLDQLRDYEGHAVVIPVPPRTWRTVRFTGEWPSEPGSRISVILEPAAPVAPMHTGEVVHTTGPEQAASTQLILLARGGLDAVREFDLPIDETLLDVEVLIEGGAGVDGILLRPDGNAVRVGSTDVQIGDAQRIESGDLIPLNGRRFQLIRPSPGRWRIRLSPGPTPGGGAGARQFRLLARGRSAIAFDSFEFVRHQRLMHSGYFSLDYAPLTGTPLLARARVHGASRDARFALVDERGIPTGSAALVFGDPDAETEAAIGPLHPPDGPFAIVMRGTSAAGHAVVRQYPAFFRTQRVAVFAHRTVPLALARGADHRVRFTVINLGEARSTFLLSAFAPASPVRFVTPERVTLDPGASSISELELHIDKASVQSYVAIRMMARDAANPEVANGETLELEIARDDDKDGDSVRDVRDNCPAAPNADQIDADRNGVGDACESGRRLLVSALSPQVGVRGSRVTIAGTGFDTAGRSVVMFGAAVARIVSARSDRLEVLVPDEAVTDHLIVGGPNGSTLSPTPFVVLNKRSDR